MAPNILPWSVSAIAGIPTRAAAPMTSSRRLAPSSRLYWLWRWRWTKSAIALESPAMVAEAGGLPGGLAEPGRVFSGSGEGEGGGGRRAGGDRPARHPGDAEALYSLGRSWRWSSRCLTLAQ